MNATPDSDAFFRHAEDIVGTGHLLRPRGDQTEPVDNTLALERTVAGIVRPASTREVAELVLLAARTGVPLYPVSRGRNMGYGDRAPAREGCVLLELARMDRIREYDEDLGHVVVEPGVTQRALYEFLRERDSPFWMDATGAGKEASVVGNTLEGGFGHTPLGNHREEFTDAEVVLGTGEVIRTGVFPRTGPDIRGIFVQSNFGVVTAMRVPLMRAPEHFASFIVKTRDPDGLAPMVETLRLLRQRGIVKSCVHMANPMRYLISSRRCPKEYATRLLDDQDAIRIMSSPLISVGMWNAAGSLYGLRAVVKQYQRAIAQAFRGQGKVQFFSDAAVTRLSGAFRKLKEKRIPWCGAILESLESFSSIQDMMKGVPTDEAFRNILWRVEEQKRLGLIWFAPVVDARGEAACRIVDLAAPLFRAAGFEMPLTLTLVTNTRLVGILSITFDKYDTAQTDRAKELYKNLYASFKTNGINTYRTSILHMTSNEPDANDAQAALERLKMALDPFNIISPGRYWISPTNEESHS